jgi:molybdate transport system substrate-binding protein
MEVVEMRCLLVLLILLAPLSARAAEVTVFAAASLTDALRDIATEWTRRGQPSPRLSFGSASTLARQIEQGAPANIFASADAKWMDYLAERHLIADGTRQDLVGNELVLIVPADHPVQIALNAAFDAARLLGPDGKLATGDPAHVPVGIYAEQALRKLGMWDAIAPRLARTDDVRSALLLVERGEAAAGIVYATDAEAAKNVVVAGVFPATTHDPITYPFALTAAGDTAEARAFIAFLSGPEARAVFLRRGFKVE